MIGDSHSHYMKKILLDHFGLAKPYRFERTLSLLTAIILGVALATVALLLWLRPEQANGASRGLSWGTPRGWYFVYLAALVTTGAFFARWPRLAATVLSLAALEMGLGFGSALLYVSRLTDSSALFPNNYNRPPYGWHPLLQALPVPTPPGQEKTARVFINSERLRGPERTTAELKDKIVIALFGGSTTLDFASPNGQSWGERLEQALGPDRYAVLNHGVAGYTTAEHVMQTAFYEQAFGVPPHCAFYYIGWNDLTNAHIRNLDPGYADFHMRGQIDFLEARRLDDPLISISPILKFLSRFAILAFDTARPAGQPRGTISSKPDPRLEEIYLRNIRSISAINRQRGIVTLWIGQVMNTRLMASDSMRGWVRLVPDRDVWPLIAHLNTLLRHEADTLHDLYVDVPVAAFGPEDFIDEGHFSPAGSMKFAHYVTPAAREACK